MSASPSDSNAWFSGIDPHDANAVVTEAVRHFGRRIGLSCSFGGAGGMALLDMAVKEDQGIDVFVLDTDVLFKDTYKLIERVEKKYGIHVRRVRTNVSLDQQAEQFGPELWARDPAKCCSIRKVEPMKTAMTGLDAWITAIRRDQSSTRAKAEVLSWDAQFGLWKVCPLVHWSEEQVMKYIGEHGVPINPMLYEGYTSIGCTHCTAKPLPGEDGRSGRWLGFMKTECGLHAAPADTVPMTVKGKT